MSSTGGVVRMGTYGVAGWPSRPRIARVRTNTSDTGSLFASSAWLMSGSAAARDPVGSGVPVSGDALEPGLLDGVDCGGVQAAATIAIATSRTSRPTMLTA